MSWIIWFVVVLGVLGMIAKKYPAPFKAMWSGTRSQPTTTPTTGAAVAPPVAAPLPAVSLYKGKKFHPFLAETMFRAWFWFLLVGVVAIGVWVFWGSPYIPYVVVGAAALVAVIALIVVLRGNKGVAIFIGYAIAFGIAGLVAYAAVEGSLGKPNDLATLAHNAPTAARDAIVGFFSPGSGKQDATTAPSPLPARWWEGEGVQWMWGAEMFPQVILSSSPQRFCLADGKRTAGWRLVSHDPNMVVRVEAVFYDRADPGRGIYRATYLVKNGAWTLVNGNLPKEGAKCMALTLAQGGSSIEQRTVAFGGRN